MKSRVSPIGKVQTWNYPVGVEQGVLRDVVDFVFMTIFRVVFPFDCPERGDVKEIYEKSKLLLTDLWASFELAVVYFEIDHDLAFGSLAAQRLYRYVQVVVHSIVLPAKSQIIQERFFLFLFLRRLYRLHHHEIPAVYFKQMNVKATGEGYGRSRAFKIHLDRIFIRQFADDL